MKYTKITIRLYLNKKESDIELEKDGKTSTIYGKLEDGYTWIRTAQAFGYAETWKRYENGDQVYTYTKKKA